MTFVHQDAEFKQLVQIVARSTGIAAALIEKDYWVTHILWAIHQTGLDIWFKGGTSLIGRAGPASRQPREASRHRQGLHKNRAHVLGAEDPARRYLQYDPLLARQAALRRVIAAD